jgi:integrase
MEQALNKLAENEGKDGRHDWQGVLAEARSRAQKELEKNHYDRSFKDPEKLIESLKRDDHKIVARMQLEGGARVAEASKIHARQLAGIHETRQGQQVGVILVKDQAKGGKPRVISVSPETYDKIANHIADHGKLSVDYERYRVGLMEAADKTGQHKLIEIKNKKTGKKEPVHDWGGTHGLRYNYAQNSYKAHIEAGKSHEETLLKVSYEMGHNRAEITNRYLGI